MPTKGNQFKTNTLRDDTKPDRSSPKSEKEKASRQKQETMPSFDLRDGRLAKIAGLFFLVMSVFFLIAFTSYLFTWQEDQSYVSPANGGWHNLFKTQQELIDNGIKNPVVENWLGKFGALLSNQFIFEWFGVASFVFVFVFFIIGYRLLFKVRLYSVSKTLAYSLFLLGVYFGYAGLFPCLYQRYTALPGGQFWFLDQPLDGCTGRSGRYCRYTGICRTYSIDHCL